MTPRFTRRIFLAVSLGTLTLTALPAWAETQLTLVGYSVAKPVYAKLIPAFKKHWKAKTGEDVTFKESYGGSGAQTRAILGGLEADVLATNVQSYVDVLVEKGLVKPGWEKRLPNGASPATSVVALVVREGNPKGIKDWKDVAKEGIEVVSLNPKTSGNARWSVLAGYTASIKEGGDKAGEEYIKGLVRNSKTLATGGREATDAFVKNGVGDVLLTFENEAKFITKATGEAYPYVAPETNLRCDFPVAVIDSVVDKRGTRQAAEGFTAFLFTPEAQAIFADAGYRPYDETLRAKFASAFAKVTNLLTIEGIGGWSEAEKKLFADGALYDQALTANGKTAK